MQVSAGHAVDVWPTDESPAPDAEQFRLFANRHTALLAAIYDSVARAARDWLVAWLGARVPGNLGQALSSLPRVQEKWGRSKGCCWLTARCWRMPRSSAFPLLRPIWRKSLSPTTPFWRSTALELTGNHGLSRQHPLERHYRNVLCGRVHTPQNDSAWQAAGKQAFQQQG